MTSKQKKVLIKIIVSALIAISAFFINDRIISTVVLLASYTFIGYDILLKAIKGILNKQVFDENFLMAIATVGALVLGDFFEAVAVMLFYQIGELFQSVAVGKSRKSITALLDIIPQTANLITENGVLETELDEIEPGSELLVKVGQRIPLDGIVTEGNTTLDTSALTGESLPAEVFEGDSVVSGCINLTSVIKVRTTKSFENSTISKILELVENSSMRKSKSEQFISRFAKFYTPIVCALAVLIGVAVPLVMMLSGVTPLWREWIVRALTFLVISCPCALVISIPLSFFGGIGCASKNGILVKGSNYLEALSKAKHFVFDKTGTLTDGKFRISEIKTAEGVDKQSVLYYAACCEYNSNHPIAECIKNSCNVEFDAEKINNVTEISGCGIKAEIEDKEVCVGNLKLLTDFDIEVPEMVENATCVYVAVDKKYFGSIIISDVPKDSSRQMVLLLKERGIEDITLLTGDNAFAAESIAAAVGIKNVKSSLLPHQKVEELEKIIALLKDGENVCYVGDGINDAPVLARADIGISMGAMGSDAAIEASDIVLMDDDPLKLITAVDISRKTVNIAKQNTVFALGVKLICLLLGGFGLAGMNTAIFADVGVMVIAVINAMRTLNIKQSK